MFANETGGHKITSRFKTRTKKQIAGGRAYRVLDGKLQRERMLVKATMEGREGRNGYNSYTMGCVYTLLNIYFADDRAHKRHSRIK